MDARFAAVSTISAELQSLVQSLADYYTKTEVDQLLAAINGMTYVDVSTLPTASASTMGKIYLVGPDASGYYSYYYTSHNGSAYSWVGPLGTTEISLANYATKTELDERTLVEKERDITDTKHLLQTIKTNVNVGTTVDVANPNTSQSFSYVMAAVTAGQKVKVKGNGGDGPRLWAFTDSSYKLLSKSAGNVSTATYIDLEAPDDGYLICNLNYGSTTPNPPGVIIFDYEELTDIVEDVQAETAQNTADIKNLQEAGLGDSLSITIKKHLNPEQGSEVLLPYLGRFKGKITVTGPTPNSFAIIGTRKDTNATIYMTPVLESVALPYSFVNEYDQYELINLRIAKAYLLTGGDFTITLESTPEQFRRFILDQPLGVFNSSNKLQTSDYSAWVTSQIYAAYDALAALYPTYITKTELGTISYPAVGTIPAEDVTCYRYDFTPKQFQGADSAKVPKVVLLSGIHPEYMGIAALFQAMKAVCELWDSDAALSALRFNVHFIVVPAASPWAISHSSRVNANGVDINRNFAQNWTQGEYVAPPNTTSTYGGSEPLSEDESQYIADILEDEDDVVMLVDVHNNESVNNVFWVSTRPELLLEQNIGAAFLRAISRLEAEKYEEITIETQLGYVGTTSPGGTAARQAWKNGVLGQTLEVTSNVITAFEMSDVGELLTISRDGILTYILTALAAII